MTDDQSVSTELRGYISTVPDAILLSDPESGTLVAANEAAEKLFGRPQVDLIGRPQTDLHPQDHSEKYRKLFDRHVEEPSTIIERFDDGSPVEIVRPDGETIPVEINASFVEVGGTRLFQGVFRDITKRRQAERALKAARDRAERYLDIAGTAIVALDCDGTVTLVNRTACELLGHVEADLVGRNWFEVVIPEGDRDQVKAQFEALLQDSTDPVEQVENKIVTADGETRYVQWHHTVLRDDEGTLTGTLSSGVDVTERRVRERELQRARRMYEDLFHSVKDAVFILDHSGKFLAVNDATVARLEYEREELHEMRIEDIDESRSSSNIRESIQRILGNGSDTFESVHVTKDGDRIPVEITASRVTFFGRPAIVAIARDVTERVRREQELERYEAYLENGTDLVTVLDADCLIKYASPSYERLLGYDPAELVGTSPIQLIHPDDRDDVLTAFENGVNEPNAIIDVVVRMRDANGNWRRIHSHGQNHLDDPAVEGVVMNSRDVTEIRERTQQLRVLDRVLRHNLHNAMTIILGYGELIAEEATGSLANYANRIVSEGTDLVETVDKQRDILELLESESDPTVIDITQLVRRIAGEASAFAPAARIQLDIPTQGPAIAVPRLEQAIAELVENAIVHSDSERPHVEINVETDRDRVTVQIADDGPPIPAEEANILTKEQSTDPLYHGSGLGLWLVDRAVWRSGGEIHLTERDPKGNAVTIVLERATDGEPHPRERNR